MVAHLRKSGKCGRRGGGRNGTGDRRAERPAWSHRRRGAGTSPRRRAAQGA
nr:MAG TPA: hypothetical protein [Caudoviricetes sp.]